MTITGRPGLDKNWLKAREHARLERDRQAVLDRACRDLTANASHCRLILQKPEYWYFTIEAIRQRFAKLWEGR